MCKLFAPAKKLVEACIHYSVLQSEAGLPTNIVASLLVDAMTALQLDAQCLTSCSCCNSILSLCKSSNS